MKGSLTRFETLVVVASSVISFTIGGWYSVDRAFAEYKEDFDPLIPKSIFLIFHTVPLLLLWISCTGVLVGIEVGMLRLFTSKSASGGNQ